MSEEKDRAAEAAAQRAAWVAALEEERRGYEVRGLSDRVAQVDAQIKAAKGSPRGRKSPESTD